VIKVSKCCNICNKKLSIFEMNDNEKEEFKELGQFTCSDCINDEMNKVLGD